MIEGKDEAMRILGMLILILLTTTPAVSQETAGIAKDSVRVTAFTLNV